MRPSPGLIISSKDHVHYTIYEISAWIPRIEARSLVKQYFLPGLLQKLQKTGVQLPQIVRNFTLMLLGLSLGTDLSIPGLLLSARQALAECL